LKKRYEKLRNKIISIGLFLAIVFSILSLIFDFKITIFANLILLIGVFCYLIFASFKEKNSKKLVKSNKLVNSLENFKSKDIRKFNQGNNEGKTNEKNISLAFQMLEKIHNAVAVLEKDNLVMFFNKAFKNLFKIEKFEKIKFEKLNIPIKLIEFLAKYNKSKTNNFRLIHDEKNYVIVFHELKLDYLNSYTVITINDVTLETTISNLKKDFISYASHELKSPLTLIKGNAELLKHGMVKDEEYKKVVSNISKQTDLMSNIIEDMLMLSRLENFKESQDVEMNLKEKINEILELMRPLIIKKNISIITNCENIKYNADPMDIMKLLKNIIENAVIYSKNNSKIEINLLRTNKMIIFIVKDNGIGIPLEHQERIFERFYRINSNNKKEGTGLGLAIVKHVVQKYKGKYIIKSKPNYGTTLQIELPTKKIKENP
jgi:two-component system phosphate regulon sensor histidine kinase PhoR